MIEARSHPRTGTQGQLMGAVRAYCGRVCQSFMTERSEGLTVQRSLHFVTGSLFDRGPSFHDIAPTVSVACGVWKANGGGRLGLGHAQVGIDFEDLPPSETI